MKLSLLREIHTPWTEYRLSQKAREAIGDTHSIDRMGSFSLRRESVPEVWEVVSFYARGYFTC